MTVAAKHFDPQLGIDIHAYSVPPGPYPTPYIGLILDPFDYIPIIGATLEVNGIKQATAGTGGFGVHIPIGVWTPSIKMPGGPQYDNAEVFMGSRTVLADGEPFSTLAMPVLDCNLIGMIPPFRLKKVNNAPLSMTLPTALNLSIPTNVFVGGPPTISIMAMAMKAGFAAFGRFAKKFKLGDKFKTLRQKLCRNLDGSFLKCRILRAEPVDIRDGSVSVEQHDFTIPGRLPLTWTRRYGSDQNYAGACGYGWNTPADIRLELDAEGMAFFHDGERMILFPELPSLSGIEHSVLELFDGARLFREHTERGQELVVRTKNGLQYRFTPFAPMGTAVSPGIRTLIIERIEDQCGNSWRFERHGNQLVRIVENETEHLQGRFIEVSSRSGRIQRMQLYDPATGLNHPLVAYRYNIGGDLVAALDALEVARTFCYDRHRMLRHTDRTGQSFYYAYDKKWRAIHAWGDDGLYDYHFHYDELLRETEIIDSLGNISRVKFDENLLPLCEIDPLDGVTIFEYDDFGRTVGITDPEGLRIEFDYDEHGNLLKLIRPDGSMIVNEYDAQDRLIATTDPNGYQWKQRYDESGLLREQTDPLGATAHYDYDHLGQLLAYTDPCGAHTHLTYDRHGLLLGVTDALGEINEFRYDPLGRLLQQANALNQYTEYKYDAKGRLLRIIQPNGAWVHCEYDAEDRLTRYVDEAGAETRLEYTGLGQISKRIQPDGHVVEYHYDTEEQLIALTNQRGERYQLIRDPLGRIVEEVDYWDQSRHYRYDAASRLCETIDPLGQRILFDTDKLGRIVKKTLPDTAYSGRHTEEMFIYDKRGQLIELRNRHRQIKRKFDASGRLIEEDQDGFKITYRYDEAGNRIERSTSAGNTVACHYDPCNRVTSIRINDETPIALQRDALGRVTDEHLSENVSRHFQYDAPNTPYPAGFS
jgi:YD repeat-containing protein